MQLKSMEATGGVIGLIAQAAAALDQGEEPRLPCMTRVFDVEVKALHGSFR
jgi:hypothetical protein